MEQNRMKVDSSLIISRHNTRSEQTLKYWRKRKTYEPIRVCYAKDIDKLIILNGHHRFKTLREKGIKKVDVIIERVQKKTEFDKYGFAIA
jgi:ParB-like chromosome segregation protein Spo0J